jgi:hypothetical protein
VAGQVTRWMHSAVRDRNVGAAALALCAAVALTACGSSDDGDKGKESPEPATSSPTSTLSAQEARTRKDVIAAYRGMTDEQVKAYAKGSLSGSKITDFATGKALRNVKDAVFVNMQNGIVSKGEPKVIASENDVELNLDSAPKKATLRVCFDQDTWTPVDKKTGKSVAPPNQVKRYTINANLENQGDRWRVTDEKADKERTC